jgi:hypothetical protein
MNEPKRFFGTPTGELIVAEVSVALQDAYDVLEEYLVGPPPMKWLELLLAAERNGEDPVAMARKLTEFNAVLTKKPPKSG